MIWFPVLLITFNRPEHTRRVLEAIMAAQPQDLYVFQDGARECNEDDAKKCAEVRQVVEDMTKGNSVRVHTNFSDRNLGCGEGTHTLSNNDNRGDRELFPILPLTHPTAQVVDKDRDARCWAKAQSKGWLKDEISYLYERLLWSDGLGHTILMQYKKMRGKGINTRKV